MADENYVRLGCAAEACAGELKAKGYCLRHYRQWQRGGVKNDATCCAHCGESMVGKVAGSMYCSKRCKLAQWKKANPERHKALPSAQRKISAIYAGYCKQCGAAFVSRRERKYCSSQCEPKASGDYVLGRHYTPPIRTCPHCGLQWSAIRQIGRSQYCQATQCHAAYDAWRRKARTKAKAGKSHVHRAKKHGGQYRYFNVLRVFERDKWKCQLCGVSTPKRLRGTLDPNAPELDHIVPLAAGGDHLIENCQCACRRCNGEKQARPSGQLWLAGFADTI